MSFKVLLAFKPCNYVVSKSNWLKVLSENCSTWSVVDSYQFFNEEPIFAKIGSC